MLEGVGATEARGWAQGSAIKGFPFALHRHTSTRSRLGIRILLLRFASKDNELASILRDDSAALGLLMSSITIGEAVLADMKTPRAAILMRAF